MAGELKADLKNKVAELEIALTAAKQTNYGLKVELNVANEAAGLAKKQVAKLEGQLSEARRTLDQLLGLAADREASKKR